MIARRRTLRSIAGTLAAVLVGCAGAGEAVIRGEAAGRDDAFELALLLPPDAERCTVARPARLADRRRPLILRASQGDALAWARQPRVVAYASSHHEDPATGARRTTTLVRLSEPHADAQRIAELRDALPLRVRFEGEPCEREECRRPLATLLDPRTLRIERGDPGDRAGRARRADSACVALAIAWPAAIELDAERRECPSASGERTEQCWQRRILVASDDGIDERVEISLGDEDAAARELALLEAMPGVQGGIAIDRRGATVVRTRALSWTELELILEDERIEREAYARREEARRLAPVDRVDVSHPGAVRAQARLREERMAALRGAARRAAAEEILALLARGYERHPSEVDLAERLVRIALDELDDDAAALRTIETALASGLASPEAWRRLRREARVAALARAPEDPSALDAAAARLLEDGIATEREEARRAARDLAAARAVGVPARDRVAYEIVEAAWAEARALVARSPRLTSLPPGAGAPISSLPATLAWLAEQDGEVGPLSVFVVARGAGHPTARAGGAERSEDVALVRVDGAAGERSGSGSGGALAIAVAGSAASIDGLLRLGALLEMALAPGPVVIDVSVASISSPGAPRTLRLEGEAGIARVRIERADAWTARHDWGRVERYLAEPLRALAGRVFPPPTLVVRATSEEEARELARVGDDPPASRCVARGAEVHCEPRPDADARGSLRRIARAALARGRAADASATSPR